MGGSDGRLYVYDIGDMAIPRESEWTDMQKTVGGMGGGGVGGYVAGHVNGGGGGESDLLRLSGSR